MRKKKVWERTIKSSPIFLFCDKGELCKMENSTIKELLIISGEEVNEKIIADIQ
jgi:hypothetical protein